MIMKHIVELNEICVDNAFMLNGCKYLYTVYRRYSMLILVLLLICLTIMIIMYKVWSDKMTYFCTNASLLYCRFNRCFLYY